jgi:hypothetical protein
VRACYFSFSFRHKGKIAVWRRPGLLWQRGPRLPSGVMVCLRVLARTGRPTDCARALAFLTPQVLLPCRYCASCGCAPKDVETRKTSSYLARRLTTAELKLAEVMNTRICINQRCIRGRFAPTPALWGASSPYRPYGPWQFASDRNAASFLVNFIGVRFSCGVAHPYFQWTRRGRGEALVSCLGGLAFLESHGESSPWWRRLYIATALALNRSARNRSRSG